MVIVGWQGVTGGIIGWDDCLTMWVCHLAGVGGLVGWHGWYFVRPGIAESWPGKSGQMVGSQVLLANFCNIGLDLITLCLGDSTFSDVAQLVVAVDEAFTMDVPTSTHPFFTPLWAVLGAFPCKIMIPIFALLHLKFVDGCGVLDDEAFIIVSVLSLLPFVSSLAFISGLLDCYFSHAFLGRRFDEIGRKDHVERADHHHLKNFVKTNEAVVDH